MRTSRSRRGGGATNRHSARGLAPSGSVAALRAVSGAPIECSPIRSRSQSSLAPLSRRPEAEAAEVPPSRLAPLSRPHSRHGSARAEPASFSRPDQSQTLDAVRTKLAQQSASLRKVFRKFDKDFSGSIDLSELRQGLTEAGFDDDSAEMGFLMAQADADGNGQVQWHEFADALQPQDYDAEANGLLDGRQYADPSLESHIGYGYVREEQQNLAPVMPATARTREREERKKRLRSSEGVKECMENNVYDKPPETPGGTMCLSKSRKALLQSRRDELRLLQEASLKDDSHLYKNHRIRHFLDTGDLRFPNPTGHASKSGIDLREFNNQLRKRQMQTLLDLASRTQGTGSPQPSQPVIAGALGTARSQARAQASARASARHLPAPSPRPQATTSFFTTRSLAE